MKRRGVETENGVGISAALVVKGHCQGVPDWPVRHQPIGHRLFQSFASGKGTLLEFQPRYPKCSSRRQPRPPLIGCSPFQDRSGWPWASFSRFWPENLFAESVDDDVTGLVWGQAEMAAAKVASMGFMVGWSKAAHGPNASSPTSNQTQVRIRPFFFRFVYYPGYFRFGFLFRFLLVFRWLELPPRPLGVGQ